MPGPTTWPRLTKRKSGRGKARRGFLGLARSHRRLRDSQDAPLSRHLTRRHERNIAPRPGSADHKQGQTAGMPARDEFQQSAGSHSPGSDSLRRQAASQRQDGRNPPQGLARCSTGNARLVESSLAIRPLGIHSDAPSPLYIQFPQYYSKSMGKEIAQAIGSLLSVGQSSAVRECVIARSDPIHSHSFACPDSVRMIVFRKR